MPRSEYMPMAVWFEGKTVRGNDKQLPTLTLSFFIMLKATIIKTIQSCCKGTALTKAEKFQVFCHVCDNMLAEGHITKIQHERYTNVFWWITLTSQQTLSF
jgi:hypothetical protein